jgi:hypothetical protein
VISLEKMPRVMTLDRLYAACLGFADACNRRPLLVITVGVPAYTVLLVALGTLVLQRFPNSGDEYVYLYQAATLGEGRLANPVPTPPEFFEFYYIAHDQGRAFGTFPPGWPLALAAARAVGITPWLLNPLLGTATLLLVWALGSALHSPRAGVLAAAIAGASSFFIFNAASFFSHTFCGALLVAAAWSAVRASGGRTIYPLAVGFLIGWAVVTRYFTGVVCGVAVIALLLRYLRTRRLRALALVALGGAPWVVFLLAYNRALSGSVWRITTTDLTFSLWFAPGFPLRGLDILSTLLLRFLLWTPPALLAAYVWYLRRGTREAKRGAIDWLFLITAVLLVGYLNRGGNQYGPRFYYEAFLFLVVFVAANLFRTDTLEAADRGTRRLFAAMAVSVAAAPLILTVHAWQARTVITERTDVYTRVAAEGLRNAVVLVGGRVGNSRPMAARDLTRNGIHYSGSVLFALDRGPRQNCRLAAAFDYRSFYVYAWNRERRAGVLSKLHCR